MLQTIDVLIGFALVMLVLSIVVTMLVQVVVSMLLNLKGRVLKEGVAHLLNLLDKHGLTADETDRIAGHLLSNTLVARKRVFGKVFGWKYALAHAVHREELIKLVLDFAGNGDLEKANQLAKADAQPGRLQALLEIEKKKRLSGDEAKELAALRKKIADIGLEGEALLRARLLNSLRQNGFTGDPNETMKAIRGTILKLEKDRPELANDVRQTMAIADHAASEFVAKINAWFDQTIDRTVESFTAKTRAWTTLFAALVALFFQVDTFELLQRLSVDKETRQMLVDSATSEPQQFRALAVMQRQEEASAAAARLNRADTPADKAEAQAALATSKTRLAAVRDMPFSAREALQTVENDPDLNKLIDANLITKPESFEEWRKQWPSSFFAWLARIAGILVTIGLLTLGAPVWYEILKNLIQFRSLVSRKDDVERRARQTSQMPAG